MINFNLTNLEIEDVEIQLTTICNLSCKLCAKQWKIFKKYILNYTDKYILIDKWKLILTKYTHLKNVSLAGFISEPTLYPYLFELLMYLKKRNIAIELYTNGNTHDEKWWKELAKYLTKNDKVIFTICGSTQELHEKYRVGSSLQQILNNAAAFKNNNKNDYCQFIRFEYNKDDLNSGKMNKIFKLFSNYIVINTQGYQERFQILSNNTDICLPKNISQQYLNIIKNYNFKKSTILCSSLLEKFLFLDSYGNEWPCCLYNIFNTVVKPFNKSNYLDILLHKFQICDECQDFITEILNKKNILRMV